MHKSSFSFLLASIFQNSCCRFQVAAAMVTIQRHFRRKGVCSEQRGNVLLNPIAVRHAADGRHNDSCMRLSNEQIHRLFHVHFIRLLPSCHFTTGVWYLKLCAYFLTFYTRLSTKNSEY